MYAQKLAEKARKHPGDDLATALLNAEVDGERLSEFDFNSFFMLLAIAGNETTRTVTTNGMLQLIRNPDQKQLLADDLSLIPSAVEEILRWTSPVNYMKRTAAKDVVVNGQKIPKGDALVLFYASGNRDTDFFDDPFTFNIERESNPHIAFGYGEHFCMGAHFARRSMAAILNQLIRRVEAWELAGEPEWIKASFVVGLKHLPVRYQIAR